MAWVYLYAIYHTRPDAEGKWQGVTLGAAAKRYKEEVNEFVVWQDGFYMARKMLGKIEEYGTLMDRDYVITRYGAKGTQKITRELDAATVSDIEQEFLAQVAELPDLEDIGSGRIETLGGTVVESPGSVVDLPSEDLGVETKDELNPNDLPW